MTEDSRAYDDEKVNLELLRMQSRKMEIEEGLELLKLQNRKMEIDEEIERLEKERDAIENDIEATVRQAREMDLFK